MDWGGMVASALAGGFLAGTAIWFFMGRHCTALGVENRALRAQADEAKTTRAELMELKGRLAAAERDKEELTQARKQIFDLGCEGASLRKELEKTQAGHAEQIRQLTQLRQEVQDQFQLIAGKALEANAEGFLRHARQIFENEKSLTAAEIDRRTQAIADLLAPLSHAIVSYDTAIKDIEKARIAGFASITDALRTISAQNSEVRAVTAGLVNALRAAPKASGRWAENTLRRVMELSGMVEHCDFEMEKHFRGDDESLRPDVVIHVAGGRMIVVDAKAPVRAYLAACHAESDEEREAFLKEHAKQLRERLTDLSNKSYWEKIKGSPDCVVMFVPGDNFVSAAFERDPSLFEDGIRRRVLICTPTTFIALARAIAYGWGQEKLAANALDIARLGKELYLRLASLGEHVSDLGRHINNAAKKYNAMVGSLESHVLPHARRFSELGVEGTSKRIEPMAEIDTAIRFPQQHRDLVVTAD